MKVSGKKQYPKSQFHYLISTTGVKPYVCANAVAGLVNRYPAPQLVGYKGEGKYDAHKAHIAKLRTIQRYLHDVGEGHDDDLVVVVDDFDVLPQFGTEALIERYFRLAHEADQRLADEHSL